MTSRKPSKLKSLIVSFSLCLALGAALVLAPRLFAAPETPAAPAGASEITAPAKTIIQATESSGGGEAIQLPWGKDAETSLYIVLAAAILALNDDKLAARLDAWRAKQTSAVAERPKHDG